MPGRVAHILKIVVFATSPDTFLRRDGPLVGTLLEPQKGLFELIHARRREQYGSIPRWN